MCLCSSIRLVEDRPGRIVVLNGQADWLDEAITEETAAWVVHVAKLAKRSKGATAPVRGTVIDGVLLDEMETEEIVLDWASAHAKRRRARLANPPPTAADPQRDDHAPAS